MTRDLRVLAQIDDYDPLELGCGTVPEEATVHDLVDRLESWKWFRDIVGEKEAV